MGKAVRGRRLHSVSGLPKPSQRVRMSRLGRVATAAGDPSGWVSPSSSGSSCASGLPDILR